MSRRDSWRCTPRLSLGLAGLAPKGGSQTGPPRPDRPGSVVNVRAARGEFDVKVRTNLLSALPILVGRPEGRACFRRDVNVLELRLAELYPSAAARNRLLWYASANGCQGCAVR